MNYPWKTVKSPWKWFGSGQGQWQARVATACGLRQVSFEGRVIDVPRIVYHIWWYRWSILVGGLEHECYVPFHIWDNPIDELHHFSRWLKPPTRFGWWPLFRIPCSCCLEPLKCRPSNSPVLEKKRLSDPDVDETWMLKTLSNLSINTMKRWLDIKCI